MSTFSARRAPTVVTRRDLACLRILSKMEICNEMGDALAELYRKLEEATLVDSDRVPRGIVTMGSRVLYLDRDADAERAVSLVYPWNHAPSAGRVSVLSSLGTALLGSAIGSSLRCTLSSFSPRVSRVDVLDVPYQPEAAGHV